MLLQLLTLPVTGAPAVVVWLARVIAQEAERQAGDRTLVQGQLLELQQRYEAGELGEDEYDRLERALLERLSALTRPGTPGSEA